jgi:phage terminase small subunit
MPELRNPRWEAFARFTAIGKKRAEAHRLAGYTAKSERNHAALATRLLSRHPEIKARVTEIEEELRSNAVAKAGLDREYVLTELRKNHEKCATPEQIIGRDGEPSGEMKFNAAGSNKALELMGKELGMFADRLILDDFDEHLQGMSGEDLRAFVASIASEVGIRVVNQSDEQSRDWILKNAPRYGLRVEELGEGADGAQDEEAGAVRPVSEAEGVPRSRVH